MEVSCLHIRSRSGLSPLVGILIVVYRVASCASPAPSPSGPGASAPAGEIRSAPSSRSRAMPRSLAKQELAGVQAAADFVNADGGVDGRRIVLDVQDLEPGADASAVMDNAQGGRRDGRHRCVFVGRCRSPPARLRATRDSCTGKPGAVADRLTGRGPSARLPRRRERSQPRFELGDVRGNRAGLAARRRRLRSFGSRSSPPPTTTLSSVADAAASTAQAAGTPVVAQVTYDLAVPDWAGVMAQLKTASPDVIILASHIPDGIAFRRAMLAANLHVGALIGSTMAECDPDFAGDLGPDAVGIFASDRPTGGFQPSALDPAARALYDRFAAAWASRADGSSAPWRVRSRGTRREHARVHHLRTRPKRARSTPARARRAVGVLGRVGALPATSCRAAAGTGPLDAGAIAAAARSIDLPTGLAPEWCRAAVLERSGEPRSERACVGGDLAVAGRSLVRLRLAADLPDRSGRNSCRWLDDGDLAATAGSRRRAGHRGHRPGRRGRDAVGGDPVRRRRRGRDRVHVRRRPARRSAARRLAAGARAGVVACGRGRRRRWSSSAWRL